MAKITFPVEASHIMMFARAIGDTNPVYHDAAAAKETGIIAPPSFPQAVAQFDPDYHLRPKPGQKWFGSAKGPSGIEGKPSSSGGLHAEQHYEYHRHLKPGDVLTVETKPGKTWEKESKRAGKLTFRERITEYRDQNGELVITARCGTRMAAGRSRSGTATRTNCPGLSARSGLGTSTRTCSVPFCGSTAASMKSSRPGCG